MRRRVLHALKKEYLPNTFIGGVGATSVTSISDLVAKTTLLESNIKNFQIDAFNNVSFFARNSYSILSESFRNDEDLIYIIDLSGYLNITNSNDTFRDSSLSHFRGNSQTIEQHRLFYGCPLEIMYLPYVEINGGYQQYGNNGNILRRGYYPRMQNGTNATATNQAFHPSTINGAKLYAPTGWEIGVNGLRRFFDSAINKGGSVVSVANFTPPSSITDLSVSNITTTTVDVTFTPPSSTNDLEFYEIWLDDGTNNPMQLYFPKNQELTASGQTITGLFSGTTYKLKLAACDEFWNGSGMGDTPSFSNEITFTTL